MSGDEGVTVNYCQQFERSAWPYFINSTIYFTFH